MGHLVKKRQNMIIIELNEGFKWGKTTLILMFISITLLLFNIPN